MTAALCVVCDVQAASGQFRISSPAFRHGQRIPRKYTCDRSGISPPLTWVGAPDGTRAFVVLVEDPDVSEGSATQWVLYDLPGDASALRQGVPPVPILPTGTRQGTNDFGDLGYRGPCPGPEKEHHYWFRIYALDAPTRLGPGATRTRVYHAMRRHILRVSEMMGTYARRAHVP